MFYFQERNRITEIYYKFWKIAGRKARIINFNHEEKDHYLACYILPCELHRNLHPFQFLREGDKVIQIGFHDQYVSNGISHPLIISGLIKDAGHIYLIDPDETNIKAMTRYKDINGVSNLSVIQTGVWKEKGVQDFVLFDDFTSSNTIAPVFNSFKDGAAKRWGKQRISEKSRIVSINVETLDNLILNRMDNVKIDFLNITVNGAEAEILQGALKTIKVSPDIKIAFPLANMKPFGIDILQSLGFIVALSDTPHRPWETEQFLYGCAMQKNPEYLLERGFRKVNLKKVTTLSDDAVGRFIIENG